jgi:hypothetical protein
MADARTDLVERELRAVRRLERRAAREAKERLASARRVWEGLSAARRMALASQIVETRARELRASYQGVLSVTYGFARYRERGKHRVWREPCVTFLVEKKWRKDAAAHREGRVPEYLFTYCTVRGAMRLCAVPTDVEDASDYKLLPHDDGQPVVVLDDDSNEVTGAITCVVQRPGDTQTYAISCRHVFGMSRCTPAKYPVGASVCPGKIDTDGTVTRIGERKDAMASVAPFYGVLLSGGRSCFDAALAEIRAAGADGSLRAAVPPLKPPGGGKSYLDRFADLANVGEYVIRTPRGDVPAKYVRGWSSEQQRPLEYEGVGPVIQRVVVVESLASGGTRPGDSGSPVVNQAGTQLLGMHIAGGGETQAAFMLPAYELLNPGNYIGMSEGDMFQILRSY